MIFDKLRNKLRAGYVFLPSEAILQRRRPVATFEIAKYKGLSLELIATKKFEFGAAITKSLTSGLFVGPALLYDPDSEEKRAGFLLSWRF